MSSSIKECSYNTQGNRHRDAYTLMYLTMFTQSQAHCAQGQAAVYIYQGTFGG